MAFSEIFGHVRPISILRRALITERVAHAYLFAGPEGLGKAAVAWKFAKALTCSVQTEDACEVCEACRKVNHGNHPDVVGVEPEGSQIHIEEIRKIQRLMVHRPLEGRWRVIIIDRAHDLTQQAANALLKVLEEPPEGNVLILVARSTSSLFPTIVSRCQILHFVPLTPSEVAGYLEEREGWGHEEAHQVAIQAQGNIRKALDLRDEPLHIEKSALLDFIENLQNLNISQVLEHAQGWATGRQQARLTLECLQGVFRDLVQMRLGCEAVDQHDRGVRLKGVVSKWRLQDLISGWESVSEALSGIERNYNVNLVLDNLLLRLLRLKRETLDNMEVHSVPFGERS